MQRWEKTARKRGFTLLEVLVSVAIIAALVVSVIAVYGTMTTWARNTSDQQTLTILNDAINRYKAQGGGTSGFTVGTNIRTLLGKLQTGVTWGTFRHQFLNNAVTYPARSIDAVGAGVNYRFYRYNTYSVMAPGLGVPTSKYALGEGTGQINTIGDPAPFSFTTTTGYLAMNDGSTTAAYSSSTTLNESSGTIWSCAGASNTAYSGSITALDFSGGYGSVIGFDFSGLTALTTLNLAGCQLNNPSISSPSSLVTLNVSGNIMMGTLTVSNLPNLTTITANSSGLTAVTLSNLPSLTTVNVASNSLTTTAINNIYNALPSRVGKSAGTITRSGNTGSGTASIATAKNWTVN